MPFIIICLAAVETFFKLAVTFGKLLSSHPKTTTMQKKYLISFGFVAAVLITSLLVLNTPAQSKANTTCCKKEVKDCTPVEMKCDTPAETSLENLSHQFISFPASLY